MIVECAHCGSEFEGKRSTAKYCSPACQKRSRRRSVDTESGSADRGLVDQTRRELEALGKVDTTMGQQVLVLAERMCSPRETGSAVASLSREHSRLLTLLSRGAKVADPVQAAKDEVARKRAQRTG